MEILPARIASGTGIDVWASQANPAAVTDWGSIINGFITAGNKHLYFQVHEYPVTTTINLFLAQGITFRGEQEHGWYFYRRGAMLMWKGGAASGSLIDGRGSDALTFDNIGLLYDSFAYNGVLVDLRNTGTSTWTSGCKMVDCNIGGQGTLNSVGGGAQSVGADCLLHLSGCNYSRFDRCRFQGTQVVIRGQYNMNSDDNYFTECAFDQFSVALVVNIGRFWKFRSNYIQNGGFGGLAAPNIVDCADWDGVAGHGMGSSNWTDFTWDNNSYWDPGAGVGRLFNQKLGFPWDVKVTGGMCWPGTGPEMVFNGSGSIRIKDFAFSRAYLDASRIPFIDCGSSITAKKDQILIEGCTWGSPNAIASDLGAIINFEGHDNVQIGPVAGGVYPTAAAGIRTKWGHERTKSVYGTSGTARAYLPSVIVTAGQPAPYAGEYGIYGSDQEGILTYRFGAATTITGSLLEVSFSTPMRSDPSSQGGQNWSRTPVVNLTPISRGNVNDDMAKTIASNAYVLVSTTEGSRDFGWKLCVLTPQTGNSDGTIMNWAYRIMKL